LLLCFLQRIDQGCRRIEPYTFAGPAGGLAQGFLCGCLDEAAGKRLGEDLQYMWRVEGELRRPVLKELHIDSLESL
jgi:hypothetical protein